MEKTRIESAIEAVLFALGDAIGADRLAAALGVGEEEIYSAAHGLKERYEKENAGIRLLEIDDAFQLASNPAHYDAVLKITMEKRRAPLSSAALETLSIIAYNQPVTKGAVDFIRGVDCSYSIARLMERNLVDESGRADAPGRPILYVTTFEFLRAFGLKTLDELPRLPEKERIEELEKAECEIFQTPAEEAEVKD